MSIFSNETKAPRPIVLLVMDGVGIAPPNRGNAVTLARTPNLDKLWPAYPHTYLKASGVSVGLPPGVSGNSEVGHGNLGAGKIMYQELPRINNAIRKGLFAENEVFLQAVQHVKKHNSTLHVIGLCSDGNVHASIDHMMALIELVSTKGLQKEQLAIHTFTDGRDSPPKSAERYLGQIDGLCNAKEIGVIASVTGRYYAMDRDERWDRTQKAYDMMVHGKGHFTSNWKEGIRAQYSKEITDEFIEPTVITGADGKPLKTIQDNDAIIFINYRADRALQLTYALTFPEFNEFPKVTFNNLFFVGMNEYERGVPEKTAFPEEFVKMPIGRVLAEQRMRQLRISESEKFPHVTYFFNGGYEKQFYGEDRIEIPSPKVATYDQKPEMSAPMVLDTLLARMKLGIYDFVLINLANGDMVGHTGVLEAGIKSVEVVDDCVGKIVHTTLALGGSIMITADHGNVEEMINLQTGGIDTEHSSNPVPFIYVGKDAHNYPRELAIGVLADIAPTILGLLGIDKPDGMTGRNLLHG